MVLVVSCKCSQIHYFVNYCHIWSKLDFKAEYASGGVNLSLTLCYHGNFNQDGGIVKRIHGTICILNSCKVAFLCCQCFHLRNLKLSQTGGVLRSEPFIYFLHFV